MHQDRCDQLDACVLGENSDRIALSTQDELRQASLCLARQARHKVSIFTYDLEAPIYDQPPFIEALKQFAIHSHLAQIRILLQDNKRVQRDGHRILELCRRLPSRMELRRPPRDHVDHPENFLVVDGIGYIKRELYSRTDGFVDFHGPLEARRLEELFDKVWEHSEPDSELRRLSL